jgi:hypothetical protein
MPKFQHFASFINHKNQIRLPAIHKRALCKAIGVEDLNGCILELNITVIHLKDNRKINLSTMT